MCGFFLRCSV